MSPEESTPGTPAEAREAIERALRGGNLERAATGLDRLAQLAPGAPEVAVFGQQIQAARDRAVAEAVTAAERWLAQDRPRRALEVLARVRALAPGHAEVRRIEQDAQRAVEAQDGRAQVRRLVVEARKLTVQGRLEEALLVAEEAVSLAPDDARALRLRDELVEQVASARRAAAGAPPATTPARLRPETSRDRARALLTSAQARLGRDEVDDAASDLEEALKLDPSAIGAEALLERIRVRRREVKRQRRLERLVADATRLLEAGRFQACLALVSQLVTLEPTHPAAQELRARAETGLREAEARRTAVRDALAEGRAALLARDWPRAIERLEALLGRDATNAEARRSLAEARARLAQQERTAAMLDSARARLERDEIEAAERDVQAVLRHEPENAGALELSERLWVRRRDLQRARPHVAAPADAAAAVPSAGAEPTLAEASRAEPPAVTSAPRGAETPTAPDTAARHDAPSADDQIQLAIRDAERLIREGRPDRALDALADARAFAPDHPRVAKLAAQAERAGHERDVRTRVRALIDRGRQASLEGKLKDALSAAEEAVALAPDDARALRLRDELQDRLDRARKTDDSP